MLLHLTSPYFVLGRRRSSTYNRVRLRPTTPSGLVWLVIWSGIIIIALLRLGCLSPTSTIAPLKKNFTCRSAGTLAVTCRKIDAAATRPGHFSHQESKK